MQHLIPKNTYPKEGKANSSSTGATQAHLAPKKTAYEIVVEAGYKGTEKDFARDLIDKISNEQKQEPSDIPDLLNFYNLAKI